MRSILSILLVLLATVTFAGNRTVTLHFVPMYNSQPVVFEEQYYPLPGGDSIAFDVLKYYITNIGLYNSNSAEFSEAGSYHLVDHSKENTTTIQLNVPDGAVFNALRFNLGIDSVTNTSGALTGDLDPIKGMYWAWQSGYINFKLEGRSSACPTRKNEFSFHLGGYMAPGYAMQTIDISLPAASDIYISIDLNKFLQTIDLKKQNTIMIPGREAVALSKKAAQSFEIVGK